MSKKDKDETEEVSDKQFVSTLQRTPLHTGYAQKIY